MSTCLHYLFRLHVSLQSLHGVLEIDAVKVELEALTGALKEIPGPD